jgi:hypothetical protein
MQLGNDEGDKIGGICFGTRLRQEGLLLSDRFFTDLSTNDLKQGLALGKTTITLL